LSATWRPIVHLRLFSLSSSDVRAPRLRALWDDVLKARALILDLRNCVGGNSKVSSFIAGSLLGPGKPLFRTVPRPGDADAEVAGETDPQAPRFTGPVALIANSNTESEPEILAAICKEYGRARLFGERTAGAFNGWTRGITLPGSSAVFAVPYTRSVSPKGKEYEGRGIEPDQPVAASAADFEAALDRPLRATVKYLSSV
jgi:Periplasmic protease